MRTSVKTTYITVLFIVYLFLSAPGFLLLGNTLSHGHRFKRFVEDKLTGVVIRQDSPALSLKHFVDGSFQKDFAKWFQEHFGLREALIRFNNQIYFSLFAKSYQYDGTILIGKGRQLYEKPYVDDFTNVQPPIAMASHRKMVAKLREVQDLFAKRGIQFIVFITPSKAFSCPEGIPDVLIRRKSGMTTYEAVMPLMADAGINLVDGQRIVLDQKKKNGQYPIFPPGGTHWTYLSAYFATADLMTEIEQLSGKDLPTLSVANITVKERMHHVDRDLAELLNLAQDPPLYVAYDTTFEVQPSTFKPSLRVSLIGGSFAFHPWMIFRNKNMFKSLNYYNYYVLGLTTYPSDPSLEKNFLPQSRDWWEHEMLKSNVVILEINQIKFYGSHVDVFLDDALQYLKPPIRQAAIR